jgi:hypothetical protein
MSARYAATCDQCGYSTISKTEKLAARGIRSHPCDRQRAKDASRARRLARQAAVDKTPKPCHHKQTQHVHGTHACYVLDRCRCSPCTAANTAYERARSRSHAYGRFAQRWIDTQPIRDHVTQLQEQGLGLKRIVQLSGYSQGAMTKLMYGGDGRPPTRRIRAEHAEKILAVKATMDTLAGGAVIDGTGTRRRLQALMTLGWSQTKLAHAIGFEVRNFAHLVHGRRGITVTTARAVRDLYEQLWDQTPPRTTTGHKGAYTRSVGYAKARGWVPPLAWDDDRIDDPAATPDVGEQGRETSRGRPVEHIAEDVEFLLTDDPLLTAADLADRLGFRDRSGIQHALRRAERPDLLEVLARNARLAKEGTAA